MKHEIMIVEQADIKENGKFCGTEEICIWESSKYRMRPDYKSFYEYLENNYPDYEWSYDDGDDWDSDSNTNYIQYVTYFNKKKTHCLLAVYSRENENN